MVEYEIMSSNEYMNNYMKERWKRRRKEAITKLGGKCISCGQEDYDLLDFDHIDRSTKLFTIAKGSGFSEERFWSEVNKCQLLCFICHRKKTLVDLNQRDARKIHGTTSSLKWCRPICELCRLFRNKQSREYKRKRKLAGIV